MSEQQHPYAPDYQPGFIPEPPAGSPAATALPPVPSEVEETKEPSKARRWLAGALLVTVGVVAGSGTTYAFTSGGTGTGSDPGGQFGRFSGYGGPGSGFPSRGGALGGPGGFGQNGTQSGQNGTQSGQGQTVPGQTDQGQTGQSGTPAQPGQTAPSSQPSSGGQDI